jgi:RNA polymerase sigma-70 factor, ECF subfamily
MDCAISTNIRLSFKDNAHEASDSALIRLIAGGEQRALQTLSLRHNLKVFSFIARLVGDKSLAEILVSHVFVQVWREAANFQGRPRISTWLLVMAHHGALLALSLPHNEELRNRLAELVKESAANPKLVLLNQRRFSVKGRMESREQRRLIGTLSTITANRSTRWRRSLASLKAR